MDAVRFGDAGGASRHQTEAGRPVEEERPPGRSTTPCRSCGSDERARTAKELREDAATFQVIVACATCGAAFAALSRN
jgi:ribosomal protein S14